MTNDSGSRIAIVGLGLEANTLAPVTRIADFNVTSGDQLATALRDPNNVLSAFAQAMVQARAWEPVPIEIANAGAGGPCDQTLYEELVARQVGGLRKSMPIDAVLVVGHGAGTTTELDDMDGPYLASLRGAVGLDVPIVVTLDPHANVSVEMLKSVDIAIAYRTNPHVDIAERLVEAAAAINELLDGIQTTVAFSRLPLVLPQVVQRTDQGQPFGDLVAQGQQLARSNSSVMNVSCFSGFALSDTSTNGMAVAVTTRGDLDTAKRLTLELAAKAWSDRKRYKTDLVPVERATRMAIETGLNPSLPPLLFADVADNPGGGGRSNTTWLLEAFHRAGVRGVQLGLFYDPSLADEAHTLGEEANFTAVFNRDEPHPLSRRLEISGARISKLTNGSFIAQRGVLAGRSVHLGRCCLVEFDGIAVAVASRRTQLTDTSTLEHFGLKPSDARFIVVKSRGHFRAGFDHLFTKDQIVEVEAPGLMPQDLGNVDWKRLPRPVYPLDPETTWDPVVLWSR